MHFDDYHSGELENDLLWTIGDFFLLQVSQALDADLSSSVEDSDEHELSRRNSKKVAQMLEQILRRGEMQVEPYRIHKFLGRLNRRKTNDQLKNAVLQQL